MNAFKRLIAIVLSAQLANFAVLSTAQAAMVSTQDIARASGQATASALDAEASRMRLASFLTREDVRAELVRMGVSSEDASARIAALTDEEAIELAGRVDKAPAGAGVVGAIVLIFLVLLVTDILGFTKVFPFTRPVNRR